ncbi:MAG: cytidylate kinase-like family protein [Lachnospiraceae bacterium]|nr:cytidylate kinase-like family protein [Lachnospiraceae bacterium]
MKNIVITISREYGSGGRAIGSHVAERLNIAFYDRTKIDRMAYERGIHGQYIKNWQGEPPTAGIWSYPEHSLDSFYYNEKNMFRIQSDIICELAGRGPCVIIGRCADYVLQDKADCFNVMIYADKDSKITRLYDEYLIRTGDLEKRLKDMDKIRAMYYKWFTGRVWGNPENYHMLLKSDVFGMDGCTDIILNALERKKSNFGTT